MKFYIDECLVHDFQNTGEKDKTLKEVTEAVKDIEDVLIRLHNESQ